MIKLNCDLGECHQLDALAQQNKILMPAIDLANIACGGHAGNKETINLCIEDCLNYQVAIGAHPSYPDLANFGRTSMLRTIPLTKLYDSLISQIDLLQHHCQERGTVLSHIKPHGALYHDLQIHPSLCEVFCKVVEQFNLPIIFALPKKITSEISDYFNNFNITIWHEGFADRKYQSDGSLLPRNHPTYKNLGEEEIAIQFNYLKQKSKVKDSADKWLELAIDTICFHSDNPNSVSYLSSTR